MFLHPFGTSQLCPPPHALPLPSSSCCPLPPLPHATLLFLFPGCAAALNGLANAAQELSPPPPNGEHLPTIFLLVSTEYGCIPAEKYTNVIPPTWTSNYYFLKKDREWRKWEGSSGTSEMVLEMVPWTNNAHQMHVFHHKLREPKFHCCFYCILYILSAEKGFEGLERCKA